MIQFVTYVTFVNMIKISDIVKKELQSSEVALGAFNEDILNLSAYAVSIKKSVEIQARKSVRLGSIVVALSRLKKTLKYNPLLIPKVKIEDLSVKTGLVEITYNKNKNTLFSLDKLYKKINSPDKYLLISQGVGEISIITSFRNMDSILKSFDEEPKSSVSSLVSITLRLENDYIQTPNVIYKFVREFALKSVVIAEIVSTFSEISFIVFDWDADKTIAILGKEMNQ